MAVLSGLVTAARVLIQQMAKQGVKKAIAGTTKSLARKKGRQILVQKARRAATRKAKEMAKERAMEAITGRKKSKKGALVKSGGRSRGGALTVQSKGTSALIPTGEVDGDAGSTAQVKGSGIDKRVDYGSLNKKIDNIVGITGALQKAFEDQNKNKKAQRDRARRLAEKERKAAREADLESKALEKKDEKGPKIKVKGGDLLGGIMNFFTQILLGSLVLGFANLVSFAQKLFKRGNAAWEMLFWGVRAALGVFVNFLPTIGKAVRGLVGIGKRLLDGVLKPLKALGTTVSNAFKTLATKLSSFVTGVVTKAINFAKNVSKAAFEAAAKGVQAAGRFMKSLPGMAKTWVKASKLVASQAWKKAGKLLPRGARVVNEKLLRGATSTVKDVLSSPLLNPQRNPFVKDIVKRTGAAAQSGIKITQKVGTKVGTSVISQAGKISQFVQKLFGSKVAKELAAAPTLTKGMAKASKGIKIPVLGPIMVAVSSLLSGDPIGKTLFKTAGAAIGGALGMLIPIPFLGMIIGEIGGEFVGDLLHELFMGGGIKAVGDRLKQKAKSILSGGKFVMDWTKEGFSRYWEGLPKFKIPDFPEEAPDWVPNLLGQRGRIWNFLKSGLKFFMGPLGLLMGKEIPNIFWMLNPMNNFPLLAKSFLTDNAVMKGALENSTPPPAPEEEEPDEEEKKEEGKRAAWDFLGWAGTGKKEKETVPTSGAKYSVGGGGTVAGPYGPILDLIGQFESGNQWDRMYPSTNLPGATEMTISEVARKASGAVGRWQNMPRFLVGRAKSVGLDPKTALYNEDNQTKIAVYLVEKGQAGVTPDMLKNNPDEAMLRLSKVWAAVPVPSTTRGHTRTVHKGESYYAGVGSNKAHITPEQMYAAMGAPPIAQVKPAPTTEQKATEYDPKKEANKGYKVGDKVIMKIGGTRGRNQKEVIRYFDGMGWDDKPPASSSSPSSSSSPADLGEVDRSQPSLEKSTDASSGSSGSGSPSAQVASTSSASSASSNASSVSSQASYEQGGTNNLVLAGGGASPGGGVVSGGGGGRGGIMAIDTAALVNRYNKSIIMGFTYKKT